MGQLRTMAERSFGGLVKAVVDVKLDLLAIDADMHSDLEALLLDGGSAQADLWGINLYPDLPPDSFLEFDSMINVRPSNGNVTRGVDDRETRLAVAAVVERWIAQ